MNIIFEYSDTSSAVEWFGESITPEAICAAIEDYQRQFIVLAASINDQTTQVEEEEEDTSLNIVPSWYLNWTHPNNEDCCQTSDCQCDRCVGMRAEEESEEEEDSEESEEEDSGESDEEDEFSDEAMDYTDNESVCEARDRRTRLRTPEMEPLDAAEMEAREATLATTLSAETLNDLKCPVCLSIMSLPYRGKCGHSVCGTCVSGKIYSCPICRDDWSKIRPFKDKLLTTILGDLIN